MPDSSTSSLPTIVDAPRARMRTMRPSARSSRVLSIRATTRSPCMAWFRLWPAMKMSPVTSFDRAVGNHESESAWMRLHTANHEVHAIRQAETGAARLNQVAALHQTFEQTFHGRPLVARNLEPLHHFPGRGRVLHAMADGGQQLFTIQHMGPQKSERPQKGHRGATERATEEHRKTQNRKKAEKPRKILKSARRQ